MDILGDTLHGGFRLHECAVYPARNIIENPSGEQHVEPKAMRVLQVLVSQRGEVVSRETLLEKVWPDTFSGDAALTRCISMLRSSLGERRGEQRYIETVSKAGYRLVAPVGSLDSEPAHTAGSPDRRPANTRVPIVAGLGLLALAAVLAMWFWPERIEQGPPIPEARDPGSPHTIAVLPFADMSGDGAEEYLSYGIAEEILNVLATIPALRVISRSSSFALEDSGLELAEIAQRLGVDSLLEGSVRKFGDRLRISVQLIDARSEVLLWSDRYDHRFDDVLLIQDQIAQAVATTLKAALEIDGKGRTGPAAHRLDSIEAHEAFLRGRYLKAQRTHRALEDAVTEFQRVLDIQPNHAKALAELAITYMLLRRGAYGNLGEKEALDLAEPLASRALNLDPRQAEVQAASGIVAWRRGKSREAEQQFKRALELNPNYAIVYHWLSMLQYRNLGQHAESFSASKVARKLDPITVPITAIHIQMLITRGLLDEAADEIERLATISLTTHHWLHGEFKALGGHWADIVFGQLEGLKLEPQLSRARSLVPYGFLRLGLAEEAMNFGVPDQAIFQIHLGRPERALALAQEQFEADPESVWAMHSLVQALVFAGQAEQARPLLERLWQLAEGRAALISSHFFTLNQAAALHALRKASGDDAGADEILDAIHNEVQRARTAGITVTRRGASLDFSEGLALLLSGASERGMAMITKAVQDGYYIRSSAPYYDVLATVPGFGKVLEIQQGYQARERRRLLRAVCEDNPYRDIWQPTDRSCDLL